jgi:HK97 family phage portal protein
MASLRQLRNSQPERNGFDDLQTWIQMSGATFPVQTSALLGSGADPLPSDSDFSSVYKSNGIVFACAAIRQRVFSQIVFRYAGLNNGRVGKLFGGPQIDILNKPWPGGTSGDLATRAIQDADLKGAFFAVREGDVIYRRDPMKMSVVLSGDPSRDEFVDIMGYVYRPDGAKGPVYTYTPSEVCHWTPVLDPEAPYAKGMSWITPILREIRSDNAATDHKANFFANSATPNMVVTFPESVMTQDQFDRFKAKMEAEYAGTRGAGKTLYLAPGADVTVVGKDFKELDFSETQGRDETRIASAAGVPPVLIGLKESLAGSSLNQGNYQAARRSFADGTMSDLYRGFVAALETIAPAPQDKGPAKLWFDISQVPFFREDRSDAATIQSVQATTIKALIDAGFEPDSVIAAVEAEDRSLLKHSGLYSVQLQKPGSGTPTGDSAK